MPSAVLQPRSILPISGHRPLANVVLLLYGTLLGVVWLVAMTCGAIVIALLGGGLVGTRLVVALLSAIQRVAALERRLTNRLLGSDIPAGAASAASTDTPPRARLAALYRSGTTWRSAAWLLLRLPLALGAGTVVAIDVWIVASLALGPVVGTLQGATAWSIGAALVAAVAALVLMTHLLEASGDVHARIAAALLGPSLRDELAHLERRTAELGVRAELAGELHDSVGHAVTASLLQASAARRVLGHDPEFAGRALEAIEEQSRAALEELDRVLGVLRDGGDRPAAAGSLERLDDLFQSARAAGMALTVVQCGDLGSVPRPVGREAFRIVQEGLTNALRHAANAPTSVALAATSDVLAITIENRRGETLDASRSGGQGLRGIAERVQALGGSLSHGPAADGGHRLHVELPLRPP